jgi:hypothetical protein
MTKPMYILSMNLEIQKTGQIMDRIIGVYDDMELLAKAEAEAKKLFWDFEPYLYRQRAVMNQEIPFGETSAPQQKTKRKK